MQISSFFFPFTLYQNVSPIFRLLRGRGGGGLESENIDSVNQSVFMYNAKEEQRLKAVQIRDGYSIVSEQCQRD